jgi:hypothetical protein
MVFKISVKDEASLQREQRVCCRFPPYHCNYVPHFFGRACREIAFDDAKRFAHPTCHQHLQQQYDKQKQQLQPLPQQQQQRQQRLHRPHPLSLLSASMMHASSFASFTSSQAPLFRQPGLLMERCMGNLRDVLVTDRFFDDKMQAKSDATHAIDYHFDIQSAGPQACIITIIIIGCQSMYSVIQLFIFHDRLTVSVILATVHVRRSEI